MHPHRCLCFNLHWPAVRCVLVCVLLSGGCYRFDYTGDIGVFPTNTFSLMNTDMTMRTGRKHKPPQASNIIMICCHWRGVAWRGAAGGWRGGLFSERGPERVCRGWSRSWGARNESEVERRGRRSRGEGPDAEARARGGQEDEDVARARLASARKAEISHSKSWIRRRVQSTARGRGRTKARAYVLVS